MLEHGGWWLIHIMGTWQVAGVKWLLLQKLAVISIEQWLQTQQKHNAASLFFWNSFKLWKSLPSGHSGEQSSTQVGVGLANGSPPLWLHEARKDHLLCYFSLSAVWPLHVEWRQITGLKEWWCTSPMRPCSKVNSDFKTIFGQKTTHILHICLSSGCSNKISQRRGLVNKQEVSQLWTLYIWPTILHMAWFCDWSTSFLIYRSSSQGSSHDW